MTREFIILPNFEKQWYSMGLTDLDIIDLENELLINPQAGSVIQDTGGLRKIRFSLPNRGKRGSCRVLYVDFVIAKKIYLIFAYPKNKKDDLSKDEKKQIKNLIKSIEHTL